MTPFPRRIFPEKHFFLAYSPKTGYNNNKDSLNGGD